MEMIIIGLSLLCLVFIILFFTVQYGVFFLSNQQEKRRSLFRFKNLWRKISTHKENLRRDDDFLQAA